MTTKALGKLMQGDVLGQPLNINHMKLSFCFWLKQRGCGFPKELEEKTSINNNDFVQPLVVEKVVNCSKSCISC